MPIKRTFKEELRDLPEVAFPDWALWKEVEKLLREHTTAESASLNLSGFDRRGTFTTDDIEALREESEARNEPLTRIEIDSQSRETEESYRRIGVWQFATSTPMADVYSGDETIVRGIAARLRDMFGVAARRLREEQEREEELRRRAAIQALQDVAPVTAAPVPRRGLGDRLADAFWQVGGGVIVGLILIGIGLWLGFR